MSIIYDALKKVQKSNNLSIEVNKGEDHPKSNIKIKVYFFYLLAAGLGFFMGSILFSFLSRFEIPITQTPKAPVKESLAVSSEPKEAPSLETEPPKPGNINTEGKIRESLVLNGVFFSQNEGYALINNQIVKEGDIIERVTVKRITLDGVELVSEGSVVKLSTDK